MQKKHGKKYQDVLKLIDVKKVYSLKEASVLVKKTSITKFDATINLSMHVNNAKNDNQIIRGTLVLPHNDGKKKKILAITTKIDEAKKLGVDYVGGNEIIDKIAKENWFDYDIIIATPDMMLEISKIARILGPKGLMPNPKNGTVSNDVEKMIKEIQAGKIEYRADKNGNINLCFARVSFDEIQIEDNLKAICNTILKNKPSSIKGRYINNAVIHTTMGPGIHFTFDNIC